MSTSYVELAQVQHQMVVGAPLPFNVRSADHTLLLASGQVITTPEQLQALIRHGALVDLQEAQAQDSARARVLAADSRELPALLRSATQIAVQQLEQAEPAALEKTVEALSAPLIAITERDPDLAIFQVLRQEGNYLVQYGMNHAIHCAIAAFLVANRLGWDESAAHRAFKAALTMNLSMFQLQGELATQTTPVTDQQHAEIASHPQRSRAMLEAAGIRDADWLDAVTRHHRPASIVRTAADELAALLSRADVYTAKLSPRCNREAIASDVAARMMFFSHRADPTTQALVKEFDLYPPGCHVRLANGETGVVIKRGEEVHAPLVAATTNADGLAIPEPRRRNTANRAHGVTAVLRQGVANMRFGPDRLLQAA